MRICSTLVSRDTYLVCVTLFGSVMCVSRQEYSVVNMNVSAVTPPCHMSEDTQTPSPPLGIASGQAKPPQRTPARKPDNTQVSKCESERKREREGGYTLQANNDGNP